MIIISNKALNKLLRLRTNKDNLRIAVTGGGCSGMSYKLLFDNTVNSSDKTFEQTNGLKVVIDSKSALFLDGMELDFSDGLNGTGFTFSNPNAKRTCGCGSSFSV